jgi:hypothetical protein
MLGLKAAAGRKNRRPEDTVKPKDIPGFSKWITSEVYIEDKIAESSLEQLALSMIENIEWINEAMNDIMNKSSGIEEEKEEEEKKVEEEEEKEEEKEKEKAYNANNAIESPIGNHKNHKMVSAKRKEGNLLKESSNDDQNIVLKTADNSFLLLKSPRRIREQTSSPIREVRKRELELIRDTTLLVLDKNPYTNTKLIDNTGKIEEDSEDDSFELIKRDIRKSFAAKQKVVTDDKRQNDITVETKIIPLKNDGTAKKIKTPEDEIKELSRLIDGASDGLFSGSNDEDLSIELDKLEKIELSQVKRGTVVSEYKSPIKFSEMPTIEPLILGSSRKKSIKKSLIPRRKADKVQSANTTVNTPHKKESVFSDIQHIENKKDSIQTFQLKPLPNDMFSTGNTSIDEPTIKLDRNFVKSLKNDQNTQNTRNAQNIIQNNQNEDINLISRLMQPTEASRRKSRFSTSTSVSSPNKSAKTSNKTSPQRIIEEEDGKRKIVNRKSENFEKVYTTIPATEFDVLKAPIKEANNKSKSPVKRQIPLSKRSLKSSVNYEQLYPSNNIDKEITPNILNLRTTENKTNRIQDHERHRLRSLSKGNSRLNHQSVVKEKVQNDSKIKNNENVLPDIIPPMISEKKEHFVEEETDWCSEENLRRQLELQNKINPLSIFREIPPVNCDEVFGRKYGSGMNIVWAPEDILTKAEQRSYEKSMGWNNI